MVSTEPAPAARRCLRPAGQHNSGAWKKPPLAVVTRPCGAGLRPPAAASLQQLSSYLYQAPRQRNPSRAGSPSPGLVRAVRASGLPAAPRAGPPLARGASGPPWQGVRQGVQRGVCEPAPARGGAVVGGKGRLIFLYS